jgi:hypothetical protein
MARVADHVYDHLLAVCRSPAGARSAAVAALARSPRSLAGALAHARPFGLEAAAGAQPVSGSTVADGLLELTWLLAGTRPADERSIVDLAVRHGLDRAGLGRALGGVTPSAAVGQADAVLERWDAALRPALVAFLGPAECDGLRSVLAGAGLVTPAPPTDPPAALGEPGTPEAPDVTDTAMPAGLTAPTVGALLDVAPAVAAHLERCDVCPDRVRAMASIRSLLAQVPIAGAPPALQPAGAGRWRPRLPIVPSAPAAAGSPRRKRRVGVVAAASVLVAAAVAAGAVAATRPGDDGGDQVAVLTRVPARNALAAVPDEVHPGQVFLLESTVDHAVKWRVRSPVAWVRVDPSSGTLTPRHVSEIQVTLGDGAPEGDLRTDLEVSGDDGSTLLVRVRGSVEHPPTIAATADGCTVTAQVEDEREIASVELRWSPAADGESGRPMPAFAGGYRAAVPPSAATWWVTAVDGRGNRARSPERPVTSC